MSNTQSVITIYKALGETPLESLERVRKEQGISKDIPMTYAGRLDPMAEGLLLILVGEECKKKEEYLNLSKEYETEILFGVETDTYDLLGKIANETRDKRQETSEITKEKIEEKLKKYIGKIVQEYPMYSSRTVSGKPLFEYAREGEEVEAPKRIVEVFSIDILGTRVINSKELLEKIEEKISKVKGDFRQGETIFAWQKNLTNSKKQFPILKLRINCGSGFYVRRFADDLGKDLGVGAIAYSIKRTRIGTYHK